MRLVGFTSLLIQRRIFGEAPQRPRIECCGGVESTSGEYTFSRNQDNKTAMLCFLKAERIEAHRLRHGKSIALELPLKELLKLRRRAIRGAIDCDIVFLAVAGCPRAVAMKRVNAHRPGSTLHTRPGRHCAAINVRTS